MPESPTPESEPNFVCDCDESMRSVCAGEPFYGELEGKRYCVLHFPGKEKSADFKAALQRKLDDKDFGFGGVWFPDEVSFHGFDFTAEAYFSGCTFSAAAYFSAATFRAGASFTRTTFRGEANFVSANFKAAAFFTGSTFSAAAYFSSATFSAEAFFNSTFSGEAIFADATFSAKAYFYRATFKAEAYFRAATFSAETDFRDATFSSDAYFSDVTFSTEAVFKSANFANHVRFAGSTERQVFSDKSPLDLQFARIENPDHVSFHSVSLHPHWFVNVDTSKFDFTNVGWPRFGKVDSNRRSIKEEIESLRNKKVAYPHRLLSIACWQLATNAEENHRYPEASGFRYMAMDANRLEHWRGFAFWRLSWWYWLASGYGERILRATVVLIGILVLSAATYTQVGFSRTEPKLASESGAEPTKREDINAPLDFRRALIYSAEVIAFQKPEPKPATTAAHSVVLLETILGPVQAALLLLAIRRKFMR